MFKVKIILLTLLLGATLSSNGWADIEDRAEKLIEQHVEAIRANNPDAVIAAWTALNKDPLALKFIQENYKEAYAYLKLKELAFRLEEIQKRRGIDYTYTSPLREDLETVGSGKLPGKLRGSLPNRNITRSSSNRDRVSNTPNRRRTPNSFITLSNNDTVRAFSNQDRVRQKSNQRFIRNNRR